MNPTLLEYFAAHETLGDFDEMTVAHWSKLKPTFEGMAGPFPDDMKGVPAWNATWRAKLRFIRAKAMVEEAERMELLMSPRTKFVATPTTGHVPVEDGATIPVLIKQKTTNLSFSEALEAMKQGKNVKRNIPHMASVCIHEGRFISKLGHVTSFLPEAVLANDWEILPEEPK